MEFLASDLSRRELSAPVLVDMKYRTSGWGRRKGIQDRALAVFSRSLKSIWESQTGKDTSLHEKEVTVKDGSGNVRKPQLGQLHSSSENPVKGGGQSWREGHRQASWRVNETGPDP